MVRGSIRHSRNAEESGHGGDRLESIPPDTKNIYDMRPTLLRHFDLLSANNENYSPPTTLSLPASASHKGIQATAC